MPEKLIKCRFNKRFKKSVIDLKSELSALKKKTLNINRSVCNLDDVIISIQASSQTQDKKVTSLDTVCKETEELYRK